VHIGKSHCRLSVAKKKKISGDFSFQPFEIMTDSPSLGIKKTKKQ
jgi:hypothetical protein